jgi:sarcosine oxidase
MPPSHVADVIVVGLGAHGSAAAWQLARRGARVIGLDRFTPPHDRGSSHGETRITRLAIGEGKVYVPLVQRSHEIWRELEQSGGHELMLRTGGLILAPRDTGIRLHGEADFLGRTIDVARRRGIRHEVLDAGTIAARFPQFALRGDERGYYEFEAGVLRPERCIAAQLEAARQRGATLCFNEPALAIENDGGAVTVRTSRSAYTAAQAIVTAGLAGGPFAARLRVLRQTLHWFRVAETARYAADVFPVFIWMYGAGEEDSMYGFPLVDGRAGIKVASEQYRHATDPDRLERAVSPAEQAEMFGRHVAGRLRGVTSECVHSAACLYTVSPDSGFVVDRHPEVERATVVSACSGHGFKHSAALGEALARRALNETGGFDLSVFSPARFAEPFARS